MYDHLTPAIHVRGRRGKSFSSETQTLLSPATSSGSLKGSLGCSYVCPGVLSWMDMPGRHSDKILEPHPRWLYIGLLSYLCT